MRLPIILAAVALALAGCNANQSPNASAQPAYVADYQIQDPIHQARRQAASTAAVDCGDDHPGRFHAGRLWPR